MKFLFRAGHWVPVLVFVCAFLYLPLSLLGKGALMPGDMGDARLNNYFLENVLQFIAGQSASLWHLSFFLPFPYVIGFSDNLFGSAPVYLMARLVAADTSTAFQIWFYFGYAANFAAAYYALRKLGGSILAASTGALIFAFALPTTAHALHAQLHYRFGIPLAITFFACFLQSKNWRDWLISGVWMVWQFYAGVYMGFFTLLLMTMMGGAYLCSSWVRRKHSIKNIAREFLDSWRGQASRQKIIVVTGGVFLTSLLLLLFYPYLQVSHLYGVQRSWGEISNMLPRWQSYFLADASSLWSYPDAKIFAGIPMRHEHQMFIGLVPLALAFAGFYLGKPEKNEIIFTLMARMLVITIVITLNIGGLSLWYFLHKLPLASAIRAVARIDQALLFPVAYLAMIAIDHFRMRLKRWGNGVQVLLPALFMIEAGMTAMPASQKDFWRQKFSALEARLPENLPNEAVLFFAQHSNAPYADELDAMWVSLQHGKSTVNGYSGFLPPGYAYEYGRDCVELPKRIMSYLKFQHQPENIHAYREWMARVVPVGFDDCDPLWKHTPPNITSSDRIYTAEEFSHISFGNGGIVTSPGHLTVKFFIHNRARQSFAANSSIGKPIRIAWRFIDAAGRPLGDWDATKNLPRDIPAQGVLGASLALDPSKIGNAKAVQISMVQKLLFWGHDLRVAPITIPLQ